MLIVTGAIGFFGAFFEAAATAIGTGAVAGGFVGATGGVFLGWSRKQVESHALRDGYLGAVAAIGSWVADLCIVYATAI